MSLTRRTALTGAVAAIAAPICPSLAGAKPADPLIALVAEAERLWAEYHQIDQIWSAGQMSNSEFEVAADLRLDRLYDMAETILHTQATSFEGLAAQYRYFMIVCGDAIQDMYCEEWAAGIGTIQAGFDALTGFKAKSGESGTTQTISASQLSDGAFSGAKKN